MARRPDIAAATARPQRLGARILLAALAMCAAGASGCTTASQQTPAPSLAGTDATDAGFTIALPETVAVLPEPSNPAYAGGDQIATAMPSDASAQTLPGTAAFAGSTPQGGLANPIAVTPAVAASGLTPPVETAAYIMPATPTPKGRGQVDTLISKYASLYQVPVELVRHVVNRESTFNPKAFNNGHWGLMQIKHATARGMGYDGPATGLFDAETNLKYAVKYLRGAWLVAGGDQKRADRLYQTGYYYEAKRKGLLEETGLGRDRKRRPMLSDIPRGPAEPETPQAVDLPMAMGEPGA